MCIPTIIKVSQNTSVHAMVAAKGIESQPCICVPYSPGQYQGTRHTQYWNTSFNSYVGRSMLLLRLRTAAARRVKKHDMQDAVTCASH